ncbi:Hypothetical protein, putative [Bodo saltans]|uniref:Uncharacterized protein n=1 Tax=Bodo saltans TaxID=75058 RepID=A0A0S4J6C1_BODSA|nr:Hypothetical protein, putative [Bodo saltans]|eukprot:CUG85796.1 Hypothetical protein, putative [Bodo saltans]
MIRGNSSAVTSAVTSANANDANVIYLQSHTEYHLLDCDASFSFQSSSCIDASLVNITILVEGAATTGLPTLQSLCGGPLLSLQTMRITVRGIRFASSQGTLGSPFKSSLVSLKNNVSVVGLTIEIVNSSFQINAAYVFPLLLNCFSSCGGSLRNTTITLATTTIDAVNVSSLVDIEGNADLRGLSFHLQNVTLTLMIETYVGERFALVFIKVTSYYSQLFIKAEHVNVTVGINTTSWLGQQVYVGVAGWSILYTSVAPSTASNITFNASNMFFSAQQYQSGRAQLDLTSQDEVVSISFALYYLDFNKENATMENISVFVRSCSFTGKTNNVLQLFFVSGIIGNSIHNIVVDMDDIRATVWLVGALTLRIQERRFSVIAVEKCDLFDVSFHAVGVHATVTMDLGDQERRHVGDPTLLNVTAWLLRSQIVYVYSSNIVGCFIQVLRCELLFQGVNGLITVPPFSMSTVATAALIFVELISLTIVNIVRGDVTLQRSIVNAFINVTIDSPSSAQVLVIAAQVDGMTVVASVMNASITISDNVSVLAPTLLVASSSSSSLSKAPIVTGIVLQSYLPSVVVSAMGGSVSSAWTRTTITIENGVFVCVSPAHSTSPLSVALVGIPKSISGGTSYILSNTSISILGDIQEDCSTPLECVPVVVILVSDTTLFAGCSSLMISGQLGCVQSFASMSSSVVASSYALQFASQSRFHVKSVVATIALAGCGPSGCFLFNCCPSRSHPC